MADKGGFGPDMRHVRFQADVERESGASRSGCSSEDGGIFLTIQDADRIVAVFRARWMRILMAQIVVVASVTGWLLFTGYDPSLPATPFQFMMGHLMTAGAGVSSPT